MVPWSVIGRSGKLRVRVLASSGIATGYAEVDLKASQPGGSDAPGEVTIKLLGTSGNATALATSVAQVMVADPSGGSVDDDKLWWYDATGASLGRGNQVDLRQLPQGRNVIRVVVKRHGHFTSAKSWVVQRDGGTFTVAAAMCDPSRTPRGAPAP